MTLIEIACTLASPLIKRAEGMHKIGKDGLVYPYICPAGYPTQGWGIRVSSMQVAAITKEEADKRFALVLPYYAELAASICPTLCAEPPERLAAITSWVFNLGATRLRASTMKKHIDARRWASASFELKRWNRGDGRVLPGLVTRREAESVLLQTPDHRATT